MAVTHPLAVRQGIANFVVDQLDEGTPPGTLVIQTGGGATVATLTFSATAFGAADGSAVCTANAITSDTNAVGGTITATGMGGDIQLSSVVISAGQTVAVSSLTYTAPP